MWRCYVVRTTPARPVKSRKSRCTVLEIYLADNMVTCKTVNGNKVISYCGLFWVVFLTPGRSVTKPATKKAVAALRLWKFLFI